MGCLSINADLFWVKAHYFLYFGGAASFWSFVTVFGKQLGISELGVGVIFTVAPVTGLISMPLFGAIADRFNIKKRLFLIFNLLNAIAFLGFAFLPSVVPSRPIAIECRESLSYLAQCGNVQDVCNASLAETLFDGRNSTTNYSYKNTDCYVKCDISPLDKSLFCGHFTDENGSEFCNNIDATPIEFLASLQVSNVTQNQDCLFVPINSVRFNNNHEDSQYPCPSELIFMNQSCVVDCPHYQKLNIRLERFSHEPDFIKTGIFWMYTFLVLAGWICMAVVTSVADCLCFETLGDKPHLYGRQRQWGAIGWGIFSMLSGYLIDLKSRESIGILKDYSPAFYLMAALLLLNLIVCYNWNVEKKEKTKTLGKDMVHLLRNPTIAVFIMSCIVVGMCTGLLWQFLFWYIEDLAATYNISCEFSNLKYVKSLQGLISIVQCFGGELPFFYISGWFINRLGHVHCVTLVLMAFAVRFFLYSILENPWAVLPIELFQGLTYGIFYANMASYAYAVSPAGSAATVQGIVGSAFEGIGVGAGSLLGGILYSVMSGRTAFRVFSFGTFVAAVIHCLLMYFIKRQKNSQPTKDYGTEVATKNFELNEMLPPEEDTKTENEQ